MRELMLSRPPVRMSGVWVPAVFDKEGRPTEVRRRQSGLPVWSLVSAYSESDGRFVVLY